MKTMAKNRNHAQACASQLRRAVTLLSRPLRPKLQTEGIGAAKLSVIGQLRLAGPMTPTELAMREGVKVQSLTRLLAELEAENWVKREPHATDGRQSVLTLTRSGLTLLGSAAKRVEISLAQVIASELTSTECAQLQSACVLLERIAQALPTVAADPTAANARQTDQE